MDILQDITQLLARCGETRLQNLVKRKPRKMRASKDVHAMCTIALCHCFLLNMQEYTNIHADKGEV